ncbi:hypothetical protein YC2023_001797 [Brassica napus]
MQPLSFIGFVLAFRVTNGFASVVPFSSHFLRSFCLLSPLTYNAKRHVKMD